MTNIATATTFTPVETESISDLHQMIAELSLDVRVKGFATGIRVTTQAVFVGQHEVVVASTEPSDDWCQVIVTSALNVELRVNGEHVSGFEDSQDAGHLALAFAEENLVGLSLIAGLLDEVADRA
ncbi:hypothetical protein GCM10025867_50500 (plasmid) [Frondihabitans sucicola]|uniref:Uncharacterized protein n=1 Tax=Frondihabitans sucicola TaxID=1268041 RepID=A0ABN6Y6W9_9MICO|nr:hypothetical protein [Frondihabitans sucicola]BDZ52809.1 hypothetical protein GCM10025867_50500 [Frondihabitans sucicola]